MTNCFSRKCSALFYLLIYVVVLVAPDAQAIAAEVENYALYSVAQGSYIISGDSSSSSSSGKISGIFISPKPSSSSSSSSGGKYSDASRISYTEAVDVISALGVMGGYPDGSFRPTGGLTRGAAAKIITSLAITPNWAGAYSNQSSFPDVPSTHTFVKYINYCNYNHLISGYADGSFRPQDPLSYSAFLKMLLCTLGHNQETEHYVGSNWADNVYNDALRSGLLMEHSNFSKSDAIDRQTAALFAFNALQANNVSSSNGTATPRSVDSNASEYANIRDIKDDGGYAIVQFGEERFPSLRRVSLDNGYVRWLLSGEVIGVYDDKSELVDYRANFHANYANVGVVHQKVVHNGCIYDQLPKLTRTGYGFMGWFTSASGGAEVTSSTPVWLQDNVTLYAHWEEGQRYVYFDANGGSVSESSRKMQNGDEYSNLPTPTRNGYDFDGWYTAKSGGSRVRNGEDADIPDNGLTLYAHWTAKKYQVTFSAEGVSVSLSGKTVTYGQSYGELPELDSKDGRDFIGWYTTRETDGRLILPTTTVSLSSNQTLYAHWGEKKTVSFTVTFRVNGSTYRTETVEQGKTITELPPAPSMDGQNFTGWKNAATGETLSLPLTVNSDLTFDAVGNVDSYTVEFHTESNLTAPASISASRGEQITLPVLPFDRDNFRKFDGWRRASGDAVSLSLTVMENLSLYARWKDLLSIRDFSYSFPNDRHGFDYDDSFSGIERERYIFMFGDTSLADMIRLTDQANNHNQWPGNCYGSSVTVPMLLQSGNGVSLSDFNSSASRPWDLKISDFNSRFGLTLKEFIEAMQISQLTTYFASAYWNHLKDLDGLCEAVSHFASTGSAAPVICIFGQDEHNRDVGHALLGYYLDEQSSDTESYLYVYDSNFPGETRYITLRKNSRGSYVSWEYRHNDAATLGTSSNSIITYVPYEDYWAAWENRGETNPAMNFIGTNLKAASVYNEAGNLIASFKDGMVVDPERAIRNNVYPMVTVGSQNAGEQYATMWAPAGQLYRVISDDDKDMELRLSNQTRSLIMDTSASDVSLGVDAQRDKNGEGLIQIIPNEEGASLSFDVRSNDINAGRVNVTDGNADDASSPDTDGQKEQNPLNMWPTVGSSYAPPVMASSPPSSGGSGGRNISMVPSGDFTAREGVLEGRNISSSAGMITIDLSSSNVQVRVDSGTLQ